MRLADRHAGWRQDVVSAKCNGRSPAGAVAGVGRQRSVESCAVVHIVTAFDRIASGHRSDLRASYTKSLQCLAAGAMKTSASLAPLRAASFGCPLQSRFCEVDERGNPPRSSMELLGSPSAQRRCKKACAGKLQANPASNPLLTKARL